MLPASRVNVTQLCVRSDRGIFYADGYDLKVLNTVQFERRKNMVRLASQVICLEKKKAEKRDKIKV